MVPKIYRDLYALELLLEKCGLFKQNLTCIKFKCQSLVTIIHRYYCDLS